ncbi:LPS export ABC transporter permease LptF [Spiribacter insolitus]|uniref:Lipopolysaccharide export system permease protein LptF n=1 Tax=Spiribacter insolitus TaxID=3122417 RepID=A0ABV3T6S8_9GAMM
MGLTRLTRYLLREVLLAWLAVTVVLVVVLLTNRLVQFMADAASGDIPANVIFTLLGLKAAANLGVVLPGSFFLGVVLALGRLYRDAEMTAMAGCGIGPWQIYRGIFAVAVPLTVLVAMLTMSLGPAAERQADRVLANAQQQARFAGVQPGRFIELGDNTTVYVARVADDGELQGIFAERTQPDGDQIWVAERGRRAINAMGQGEFLVLEDGWRYEGEPGQAAWRMMQYAEHGVRIAEPEAVEPGLGRDAQPPGQLLADGGDPALAELQLRLSLPMMVLVLALGSLPLASTDPRSGRYGRVVLAVLLFMIYFNLLYTAADWVGSGLLPAWVGVGWVHALALLAALLGLWTRLGVRWRRWAV